MGGRGEGDVVARVELPLPPLGTICNYIECNLNNIKYTGFNNLSTNNTPMRTLGLSFWQNMH